MDKDSNIMDMISCKYLYIDECGDKLHLRAYYDIDSVMSDNIGRGCMLLKDATIEQNVDGKYTEVNGILCDVNINIFGEYITDSGYEKEYEYEPKCLRVVEKHNLITWMKDRIGIGYIQKYIKYIKHGLVIKYLKKRCHITYIDKNVTFTYVRYNNID